MATQLSLMWAWSDESCLADGRQHRHRTRQAEANKRVALASDASCDCHLVAAGSACTAAHVLRPGNVLAPVWLQPDPADQRQQRLIAMKNNDIGDWDQNPI